MIKERTNNNSATNRRFCVFTCKIRMWIVDGPGNDRDSQISVYSRWWLYKAANRILWSCRIANKKRKDPGTIEANLCAAIR